MAETAEQPKSIGVQTYEAVSALIREGLKPTEAFAKYGEETGKNAATVATAYYRTARGQDDATVAFRPRGATPKIKRGRPVGSKTQSTIATRVRVALKQIEDATKALQELMPAMTDADQMAEIRRLMRSR
jgi:hypothetical protein